MKIKKIKIKGLYGYIDKEISFNDDISLLVGINGSGKTSVLNLINWLLKPSIPNLCVTDFLSIDMEIVIKNVNYLINCKHLKSQFIYKISSEKRDFHPLTVRTKKPPRDIKNDDL